MKENNTQHKKLCDSWYHQKWFRIVLVIVGLDMVVLGAAIALNLDILSFIQNINSVVRIIGGFAYVLVAMFVIHYALSYEKLKKETYLVCRHCVHAEKKEKEE